MQHLKNKDTLKKRQKSPSDVIGVIISTVRKSARYNIIISQDVFLFNRLHYKICIFKSSFAVRVNDKKKSTAV
jgi:hypothetical protein